MADHACGDLRGEPGSAYGQAPGESYSGGVCPKRRRRGSMSLGQSGRSGRVRDEGECMWCGCVAWEFANQMNPLSLCMDLAPKRSTPNVERPTFNQRIRSRLEVERWTLNVTSQV